MGDFTFYINCNKNMKMFPPEIIENILSFCDGKTLKVARNVCLLWRNIVDYLTKETDIWKYCCRDDIPQHELLQYKYKWVRTKNENERDKWLRLYENWLIWHNIDKNVEFDINLKSNINRISCINAMGSYLALGFENGTVRMLKTDNFSFVRIYRHLNIPVESVSIVSPDDYYGDPSEVLVYQGQKVYINDFLYSDYHPAVFPYCYKFSSYQKYICGVTLCGKITIACISTDTVGRKKGFNVITYVRIYSPETVTSVKLWDGLCTILVDNKVKTILYAEGYSKSSVIAQERARLQFSGSDELGTLPRDVYIFNCQIIITVTKGFDSHNRQMLELYIFQENNQHFKKMFVIWNTFRANVSCMFLHGNTLVIGLTNGLVYFYQVNDWKLFDIANYSHRETVSELSPIISIDAVESYGKRIFYVATNMKIYELIGYSIPEEGLPQTMAC